MNKCEENQFKHFWAEVGGGFFRCSWCGTFSSTKNQNHLKLNTPPNEKEIEKPEPTPKGDHE